MRVLVTGGAGFIGSHTVDALAGNGAAVTVLDNLSSGRAENLKKGSRLYRGDITDREFVMQCVRDTRPEVVFHLAAQVSAPKSQLDPAGDASVNVVGTLNLLQAARDNGVRKVIFASSAAVYGNPCYLPVDLRHPVEPISFYGLSKLTAERCLHLYRDSYGLDFTVLRYANVYGPRQDAGGEGGVVSIFIDTLLRGDQPVIFGDGGQTRDFVHVFDVAAANLCAMERGSGMTFNIGTGRPASVNRLFGMLKEAAGRGTIPRYESPRAGDIRDSWLDGTPAAEVLGWTPKIDLDRGIKITLDCFIGDTSAPPGI